MLIPENISIQDKRIFQSLMYFVSLSHYDEIIEKISKLNLLNDYILLFNNKHVLINELFNKLFAIFVKSMNNQFYKCLWILIHTFPIYMTHGNKFINYFFKSFIPFRLVCNICKEHYLTFLSTLDSNVMTDNKQLFEHTIYFHDYVNSKKNVNGEQIGMSDHQVMQKQYVDLYNKLHS